MNRATRRASFLSSFNLERTEITDIIYCGINICLIRFPWASISTLFSSDNWSSDIITKLSISIISWSIDEISQLSLICGVFTSVDLLAIYGIVALVNQIRGYFAVDERMSVQLMDFRRGEIATLGKNVARSRLAGRLCLELLHKVSSADRSIMRRPY